MGVELLDKTRKINRLLHSSSSKKLLFNDVCDTLSEILDSNIVITSKRGKILGQHIDGKIENIGELIDVEVGEFIDKLLNERILSILSTKENLNLEILVFSPGKVERFKAIVCPVEIAGTRLGSLFIYRTDKNYGLDEIVLSEYGATVVGLELTRSINEEIEEDARSRHVVKSAISTLSFSELTAISCVFDELEDGEGVLVASKIADKVGITRSVIVNALRKFESAGVIESRSSGMRGTYIKILNDYVYEELEIIKKNMKKRNNLKK